MGLPKIKIGQNDKKKAAITLVLLVILFFVLNRAVKLTKKHNSKITPLPLTASVFPSGNNDVAVSDKISRFKKLIEESKKVKFERDPFMRSPEISLEKEFSEIVLSGIIWDEKTPRAIIDGKIVGIGSRVKNNTVVAIKPDSVVLNDGEQDFKITLKK
jgi:hypothetical protein